MCECGGGALLLSLRICLCTLEGKVTLLIKDRYQIPIEWEKYRILILRFKIVIKLN